ncbi:MAG: single-stranded DNA-binding protein [Marmoricola sp.]
MNDTLVTLSGYLGSDVTVRDAGNGVPVAGFRVATTPRRFSRKDDAWVDGDTQWYSVSAWRQLAENCAQSLRRGDPVVLHGRLTAEVWQNKAGIEVSSMAIELVWVGHDLSRGTSRFVKLTRSGEAPQPGEEAGREDPPSPLESRAPAA